MNRRKSQKQNQEFWDKMAEENEGHEVSWWDINMKKIEVKNIIPYLDKKDFVLDVGCSNGASTLDIYKQVKCKIHGIDYSQNSLEQAKKIRIKNLSFEYGNIIDYKTDRQFDKAFSIRCLINLMSDAHQKKALINIHRLLKVKGIYIMAEAFYGGLVNLNKARQFFGLNPLKEPSYNHYLRENQFESFITDYFNIIEINKYASLYYIGTRLFQYLAMDSDPTDKDTILHRFFSNYSFATKHSGDYSPQKIYVLEKR